MRTPVYNTLTTIDKTLFIKSYKNFIYCFITTLIKGEALAVPIAGGAELFKLLDNSAAILFFPFPSAL